MTPNDIANPDTGLLLVILMGVGCAAMVIVMLRDLWHRDYGQDTGNRDTDDDPIDPDHQLETPLPDADHYGWVTPHPRHVNGKPYDWRDETNPWV